MRTIKTFLISSLFITFFSFSCKKETNSQFYYNINHNKIGVELLKDNRTKGEEEANQRYILKVSQENMPLEVFKYLSFKNEPYLSSNILFITEKDTIRPLVTHVDRAYEMSREFIYLMLLPKKEKEEIQYTKFQVNNFFFLDDTLRIKL